MSPLGGREEYVAPPVDDASGFARDDRMPGQVAKGGRCMAENPMNRNPLETDEALSPTGGLPPDFFAVPESPASDRHAQPLPARDVPLPSRFARAPAPPHVMIERRTSLAVVLVVIAGNIVFFLGGGLVGWT